MSDFLSQFNDELDLLYGSRGPTLRQRAFRDAPEKYRLYGGAVGGGKTVAICAEMLRACLAYEGNRVFLCRHEAVAFTNTTLQTLLKLISEVEDITSSKVLSNHHKTGKTLYFINGSTLLYGALGDINDLDRIKSLEVGAFGIDEASETVEENFQMLTSRLRWKLPDGTYPHFFGLLASNPEPGWVKNTFVTPSLLGKPVPNHCFIQALPKDNPHLPPNYVENLRKERPASWVTKYLDGSWTSLEGQIYDEFDWNVHVLPASFNIPAEWERFRAIDHGQAHPTCCLWFAVDCDGNIYVYREYYQPGIVSKHCKEINALSEKEEYSLTVLPPECWGKKEQEDGRLWSIADEYMEHGIPVSAANNTVIAGINRVKEHFKLREDRYHPITGNSPAPSLYILKSCINTLIEIEDYIWKKYDGREDGKERPTKKKDHAMDSLRYGTMTRPAPTTITLKTPVNTFLAIREKYIQALRLVKKRSKLDISEAYCKVIGR